VHVDDVTSDMGLKLRTPNPPGHWHAFSSHIIIRQKPTPPSLIINFPFHLSSSLLQRLFFQQSLLYSRNIDNGTGSNEYRPYFIRGSPSADPPTSTPGSRSTSAILLVGRPCHHRHFHFLPCSILVSIQL
jgi:hypothetical protein